MTVLGAAPVSEQRRQKTGHFFTTAFKIQWETITQRFHSKMKQKYKSALEILTSATLGHTAQREIPIQFAEIMDSFIRILLVSSHYSHPPQSIKDAAAINWMTSIAPFYR